MGNLLMELKYLPLSPRGEGKIGISPPYGERKKVYGAAKI